MKAKTKSYILFVLYFILDFSPQVKAQEISEFYNLFLVKEHKHIYTHELINNRNQFEFISSLLFVGYKKFISSQDGGRCFYTPSCSEYALNVIKKRGLLIGIPVIFDRLSRCNSNPEKEYEFDPKQNKYIDQ